MKNEFNFQSINPWRTAAKTLALALPALYINAANYGWQGLFVMSALTAGLIVKMNQNTDHKLALSRRSRDLTGKKEALLQTVNGLILKYNDIARDANAPDKVLTVPETEENREQRLSRTLSPLFGLPVIEVNHHDKKTKPFYTDLNKIHVDPTVAEHLTDGELAWVIAHELEHMRRDRDLYMLVPIKGLNTVAVGTGLITGGMALGNAPASFLPGLGPSAAGAAISLFSLWAANAGIWREVERRCDSNALRVTGNLNDAKSALTKIYTIMDTRTSFHRVLPHVLQTHPSLTARLANLDRTWDAMQCQAQQKNAARTPAPETP